MASPSTVITLGFGSFGSVSLLPTLGFGSALLIYGPAYVCAIEVNSFDSVVESQIPGADAVEVRADFLCALEAELP